MLPTKKWSLHYIKILRILLIFTDVGGTIFSLLMLIFVALIGGKLITGFCWVLLRFCKVDIKLPPLLGMLLVGIILKNVPYNFGQFGRAECNLAHQNVSFVDSIQEFDRPEDHESFRKRSVGKYIL